MEYHAKNCDEIIFGIDRTFNLGPLFLTVLNYKDSRMIRRANNQQILKIGPMFLHKEATKEQYEHFLSHVKRILL